MNDILDRVVTTKEGAHDAARQAYSFAQTLLMNEKPVRIRCEEWEDDIGTRQRNFLHGVVLRQISEQVVMPDGTRYVMATWKEFNRARFLGDRWESYEIPGQFTKTGKPVKKRRKVRVSTEELGARAYSEYIDKVIDNAVMDWNVVFEFRTEERDSVRVKRKAKAKQEPETCAA